MPKINLESNNWVGFSIGSKGEFDDYRSDAIFGKGLNVGVTTSGHLFIENVPETEQVNDELLKLIQKWNNSRGESYQN